MEIEKKLLQFIHLSERLKNELRNGRTSTGKQESVAEHTWRVSLIVCLFSRYIDRDISVERALKMAIVHDLAELLTGDKPYFVYEDNGEKKEQKHAAEYEAMQKISAMLPDEVGDEIFALWQEYEEGRTEEAKLVKSVDKIEAQIQHNEMSLENWNAFDHKYAATRLNRYCQFDAFLTRFKDLVQDESMKKIAK